MAKALKHKSRLRVTSPMSAAAAAHNTMVAATSECVEGNVLSNVAAGWRERGGGDVWRVACGVWRVTCDM
jgi:hypothetical protein